MNRKKYLSLLLTLVMAVLTASADRIIEDIPKWMRFVEITGSNVNLRMQPSIDGEKLEGEYFQKGEVAPVLDETDDWIKLYYAYSPKQYVWISKQYTKEAHQEVIPDEYRFTTFLTYGDKMLIYKFDGRLTNIVYKYDYPFETARIWVNEPDLYKNNGRFMSVIDTGIDWATLMPKIIKTIPDRCVYKYLRGTPINGESHNFRTDNDTEEFDSSFYYVIWAGDLIYELSIYALPTNKPDELLVIAHSASGIDGMVTDLLTSMHYNYKTGEYRDISEGLPGVVIDKLGLDYNIFKDNPEYQREARQSTIRHLEIGNFVGIPMVTVTGPELALIYPIDTYDIEGYTEQTTVYYLWDGEKFVKLVRSPYIDMLSIALRAYYDVHSVRANDDFSEFYSWLMPHFAEACEAADANCARTGRKWLDFDPFTFMPKGQKYDFIEVDVITAANRSSDRAEVKIYPKGTTEPKTITIEAMLDNDAGTYLISDFKDENGVSVLQMAHNASGK